MTPSQYYPQGKDFKVTPWRATLAAVVALSVTGTISFAERSWFVPQTSPQEMILSTPTIPATRQRVAAIVAEEAEQAGVPVAFALAVAHTESRFNERAVGPTTSYGRAHGVMQVLPSTAQGLGHSGSRLALLDARVGARLGNRYLAEGLRRCNGDMECAARFHHGGPNLRLHGRRTVAYGRTVAARARYFQARGVSGRWDRGWGNHYLTGNSGPSTVAGMGSKTSQTNSHAYNAWLNR